MPEYRRAYYKGGTYFFTVVTYKRYPVFGRAEAVDLLNRCIQETQVVYPFTTEAMVLLPEHLHAIWSLPINDADFSVRWKRIKTTFTWRYQGNTAGNITQSMRKSKERGIWQRRFWEHLIRDQTDFNRHCDYIHYNPVKHGLARSPRDWGHSTFRAFVERGLYPEDWGTAEPEGVVKLGFE